MAERFDASVSLEEPPAALLAAVLAAFAGAVIGNRLLAKITLESLHRLVAVALALVAVALMVGLV